MVDENETLLDMDDLDSLTLDNVDEAPDFMCPPSGKYLIGVKEASIQRKEDDEGTKQSIRIIYYVRNTMELNNQADDLVPPGTLFSENFQATKQGLEFFKTRMKKVLGEDLSGITIPDMLAFLPKQFGEDGSKDIETVLRKVVSKKDGTEYENVRFQKMETVDRG